MGNSKNAARHVQAAIEEVAKRLVRCRRCRLPAKRLRGHPAVEDDGFEAIVIACVIFHARLEIHRGVAEIDRGKLVRHVARAADLGIGRPRPVAVERVIQHLRIRRVEELDTIRACPEEIVVADQRRLRSVIHEGCLDGVIADCSGGAGLQRRTVLFGERHRAAEGHVLNFQGKAAGRDGGRTVVKAGPDAKGPDVVERSEAAVPLASDGDRRVERIDPVEIRDHDAAVLHRQPVVVVVR